MSDLEILKQLYYGNHLNNLELERALKIIYLLQGESINEKGCCFYIFICFCVYRYLFNTLLFAKLSD